MTSLRIVQVVSKPQRRGAEVFALGLAAALEERGCTTAVVALYALSADDDQPLPLRSTDLSLGGQAASPLERVPGWHPGLLADLQRFLAGFRPDIVQVNGSRSVKYGSLARRRQRLPGWALVYRSIGTPGDWLRGPLHRALYRRLVVSRVDGIVAVSEATRASLEASYRLRVPVEVIPRGVDLRRFVPRIERGALRARLGTPPDAPVIVYLGSLSAEKRPDRVLRVAREAARRLFGRPAPELWMIGRGPLAAAIAAAAYAEASPPKVRLLGGTDDPASWLAAADLLLLASDTEGTPGVILEAACVGVPAVATRVGGVAESIEEGVTGLTAAPADEDALAAAVVRLLADADLRRAMGRAARRLVEQRFALSPIAERYLALYDRVLALRRGTA